MAIMAGSARRPTASAPAPAAAFAELLLRKPDAGVEGLLRERTAGLSYDVASHFKLVAALSRPERVVKALRTLLSNILLEPHDLYLPRWIPTIVGALRGMPSYEQLFKQRSQRESPPSVKGTGLWDRRGAASLRGG
jgi:hypothetical protein